MSGPGGKGWWVRAVGDGVDLPGDEAFAYLTTVGRVTGRPHRIEIWFARHDASLYMLAGGGEASDWVANLQANAAVRVEVGAVAADAAARVVTDESEAATARRLLYEKYQPDYAGDLAGWRDRSLPVAVDLTADSRLIRGTGEG